MKRACFVLVASLFFIGTSCTHEDIVPIAEFDTVCFEEQILPVFQTGCAISGCHSQESSEGGYVYSDYESIMKSITPGSSGKSKAYQSIISIWSEHAMPPDRPLSEAERTLIRIWIEQGALNTSCINGTVVTNDPSTCFSSEVLPILLSSCGTTGCHDVASHEEGVTIVSYTSIMSKSGLVVAENPTGSDLYQVLNKTGEDRMPPSPYTALTETQKQTIYNWIKEGATDLDCADSCDPSAYTFSLAISSMIENNCRSCHSGTTPSGGILLTSYADIKAIADSGSLIDVVYASNGKPLMPPSNQLSSCELQQLESWVADGSLNN